MGALQGEHMQRECAGLRPLVSCIALFRGDGGAGLTCAGNHVNDGACCVGAAAHASDVGHRARVGATQAEVGGWFCWGSST